MGVDGRASASLAAGVTDRLRSAIVDGRFELGEALSEDLISTAFEVSRTPVREALKALRMEGLVEIVPKSGTYIFRPDPVQLGELCECRYRIEAAAVDLSLTGGDGRLGAAMHALLEPMASALADADLLAYNKLDARFHLSILDQCGNRYLRHAYDLIHAQVSAIRVHMSARTAGAFESSMREHRDMAALAETGDAAGLNAVLAAHISRARQSHTATLRERDRESRLDRRQRLRDKLAQ